MKICRLSVSDLTPYDKNAKIHTPEQIEQIKASIEQFGMNDPIGVWGDKNIIVEGHGRLMALKELGHTEVDCIRLDHLTDDERKAYTLAHNKLTLNTDFDFDLLQSELDAIEIDMAEFGFEELEAEIVATEQDDVVPDVPDEPIAKLGDIYQLGEHRLMCGDSTSVADVDKLVDGATVHLVLTDPPYGISIVGENGKVGADNLAKNGQYMPIKGDDTTTTTEDFYNLCVDRGFNRFILFGGNYFIKFLPYSDGWIIWDKRGDMNSNNFADGEMAWCSFHTPVRIYKQIWSGMIREGERDKRVHPTQKPIKMLSEIINDFTTENDIVLDGFGGSGSTLIACEKLNRKCLIMEYEPHYCDVIIQRWEDYTGKKAVKL